MIQTLREKLTPRGWRQYITVAAFGKHPGWGDHIDGLGINSSILIDMKRLMYDEGIRYNIEVDDEDGERSWRCLKDKEQLIEFGHCFVMKKDTDVVVGQLWASQDASGRKDYPMVVCVHCRRIPLTWILKHVLSRLEKAQERIINTTQSSEVKGILNYLEQDFNDQLRCDRPVYSSRTSSSKTIAALTQLSELAREKNSLMRLLYHLERQDGCDTSGWGKNELEMSHVHMRVPITPERQLRNVLVWMEFLTHKYGLGTRVFSFLPHGHKLMDLILAEPVADLFYCLRADLEALPYTSSIPYPIDPSFKVEFEQMAQERAS